MTEPKESEGALEPRFVSSNPAMSRSSSDVTDSLIHTMNPARNINLDPDMSSIRSLKLLRPFIDDENNVQILMKNEAVYHKMAVKSLSTNDEVRKFMGGYTFNNVMKLTAILKQRHHKIYVEKYFGDGILKKIKEFKV